MDGWAIRDFVREDLESVVRLDATSPSTAERPVFAMSDMVTGLLGRHPAVVAVTGDRVIGAAVSRVDEDRAWILRISLDPDWRGLGLGSALIAELEYRLLAKGVRRVSALLPDGETGAGALTNSGFTARAGITYYEKVGTVSPRTAGVLARLGGAVPPAGLWRQVSGMTREKTLIERRIVLPLSRSVLAAEHGVVPPRAAPALLQCARSTADTSNHKVTLVAANLKESGGNAAQRLDWWSGSSGAISTRTRPRRGSRFGPHWARPGCCWVTPIQGLGGPSVG